MLTAGRAASVLAAGRGAAVARVVASCAELGLRTAAVAADADPQIGHAGSADTVVRLPGPAQLDPYDSVTETVRAARATEVDLVHPGFGALAEDPELPAQLAAAGIGYLGPPERGVALCRDKAEVIAVAGRIGVPVLPHATGDGPIRRLAAGHGYPLILKPPRGCMGTGLRVVTGPAELDAALAGGRHYAELFVRNATVLGVTVAVDEVGGLLELGERETLLAAGSRKLVDAAPVECVPPEVVAAMRRSAADLVRALGLRGVVTVEFLARPDGYSVMEVNARLTGAFRMCEAQTGVDLVHLQLDIARGRRFGPGQTVVDRTRHAAEGRFYPTGAADPGDVLTAVRLAPAQPGVTTGCTLRPGRPAPADHLLANVLAVGADRADVLARLYAAVTGTEITGIPHHGHDIIDWWTTGAPAATPTGGAG